MSHHLFITPRQAYEAPTIVEVSATQDVWLTRMNLSADILKLETYRMSGLASYYWYRWSRQELMGNRYPQHNLPKSLSDFKVGNIITCHITHQRFLVVLMYTLDTSLRTYPESRPLFVLFKGSR